METAIRSITRDKRLPASFRARLKLMAAYGSKFDFAGVSKPSLDQISPLGVTWAARWVRKEWEPLRPCAVFHLNQPGLPLIVAMAASGDGCEILSAFVSSDGEPQCIEAWIERNVRVGCNLLDVFSHTAAGEALGFNPIPLARLSAQMGFGFFGALESGRLIHDGVTVLREKAGKRIDFRNSPRPYIRREHVRHHPTAGPIRIREHDCGGKA